MNFNPKNIFKSQKKQVFSDYSQTGQCISHPPSQKKVYAVSIVKALIEHIFLINTPKYYPEHHVVLVCDPSESLGQPVFLPAVSSVLG